MKIRKDDDREVKYDVGGVGLTFNEVVQKARADAGGKIMVDGKDFSCKFFIEASRWEKFKERLLWAIIGCMYVIATTIFPLINAGLVLIAVPEAAVFVLLVLYRFVFSRKRLETLRELYGIEDLELEALDLQRAMKWTQEDIDQLKKQKTV